MGWLGSSPLLASDEGLLYPFLHHHASSPKGVARLSFTARIERTQFHRARSASKKGIWPLPSHPSKLTRDLFRDGG
jgi:hypothetical protein